MKMERFRITTPDSGRPIDTIVEVWDEYQEKWQMLNNVMEVEYSVGVTRLPMMKLTLAVNDVVIEGSGEVTRVLPSRNPAVG